MLEMGGRFAIRGHDGPFIGEDAGLFGTHVDHGLDGDGHAGLEAGSVAFFAVVGHLGLFVELAADAVADEFAHNAVTILADVMLDAVAEISEHPAVTGILDGIEKGFFGGSEEMQRFLGDVANGNGEGVVADPAVVIDADVDFDDVAVLDDTRTADAVNDLLVDGDADVAGELAVTEEGAGGTSGLHLSGGKTVDLGGGGTGVDLGSRLDQDITRDLAGLADGLLLRAVADGDVPRFHKCHDAVE